MEIDGTNELAIAICHNFASRACEGVSIGNVYLVSSSSSVVTLLTTVVYFATQKFFFLFFFLHYLYIARVKYNSFRKLKKIKNCTRNVQWMKRVSLIILFIY